MFVCRKCMRFFFAIVPVTRAMDTHVAQLSQVYMFLFDFGLFDTFITRFPRTPLASNRTKLFRISDFKVLRTFSKHIQLRIHCYIVCVSVLTFANSVFHSHIYTLTHKKCSVVFFRTGYAQCTV